ncbi:PucR family transcriptional regulator [Viridibacillus arvi]|uniref:PucR family transcriptional regulator n=1 Tax=Viridibacillus arvi TaxID=263475 RepID=UPI0036E96946
MSTNLTTLFPSINLLTECPVNTEENVHIFHNTFDNTWMTVDKKELTARDYALLTSLFNEIQPTLFSNDSISEKWIQFLLQSGPSPIKEDCDIRIIQLHFKTDDILKSDLNQAVQAYFNDAMQLIFISTHEAVLIEQKASYIHTFDDFSSFIVALESDFFLKVKIYIGKFHSTATPFSNHFIKEKEWFNKGLERNHAEQIYTMEKTFPINLIEQMSDEMKQMIRKEVLEPIEFDMELLQTVQLFFENGFNASVTAKELHVHRNTLQYRLTKFQDITGISVRYFDGALVSYCASLIASEDEDKAHN